MNAQSAIEPHVVSVPLFQLDIDPLNPRQAGDHDPEETGKLAGSIEALGLMEPLAGIVRGDRIGIVSGGRRLTALQSLEATDSTRPIPVMITEDETLAAAWALTPPATSRPIHPADEVQAYAKLQGQGMGIDDIAKAHATTVRHVRQRLKLAALPKTILQGFKKNEINLGQAQAFTIAPDDRQAKALFETVRKGGHWSEYAIRRELTGNKVTADDRRVKFVGIDAYVNDGGRLTEDLFGDGTIIHDAARLDRLFFEKLNAASEVAAGEGWGAVTTSPEQSVWDIVQGDYSRQIEPDDNELPDADQEELERLAEQHDETDDTTEGARIRELLDRIKGEHEPEVKARLQVIFYVDHKGRVQRLENVTIPGVDPQGRASHANDANTSDGPAPTGSKPSPAEEPKKVPQNLLDDMASIRLAAVQAAAMTKPELMLDLLAYTLSNGPGYPSALAVRAETPLSIDKAIADQMTLPAALTDNELKSPTSPTLKDLDQLQSQGKKHRNKLIAEALARALPNRRDAFMGELEQLTGSDIRKHWTPDASFFKRMPADRLAQAFDEVLELNADDDRRKEFLKLNRGQRAHELGKLFTSADDREAYGISKAQSAAIDGWLPVEMKAAA